MEGQTEVHCGSVECATLLEAELRENQYLAEMLQLLCQSPSLTFHTVVFLDELKCDFPDLRSKEPH